MELNQITITEASLGLKKKKFSVRELVSSCFHRIEKFDPLIKAFITLNKEGSFKKAYAMDKIGSEDKPLWGIPVAVKDNFCTQGLRTTASAKVLENFVPPYSATVVRKLEEAGAIIIGKTNMDAWAHGSSTETSQFFTTRNPWDTKRLPGGSSGGSAAAVAADMVIAGIGSETAGSIRQPAAWCGIVGFKPTYGVISRYGLIAMASSLDCPGPLTKTVSDAKLLFSVLQGRDNYDATTIEFKPKSNPKDLKKIKIGVPQEYFPEEMDKEIKLQVLKSIEIFRNQGAEIVEISLIDPHFAIAVYTIEQRSEVSSNLARYDGIRYGYDRASFGEEAKRRTMLGTYTLSSGYYDAYYLNSQKARTLICDDFEKIFRLVDVIVAPTSPFTALSVGSTRGSAMFGELQDILVEASSLAGLPGISINCGFSQDNLPIGFQMIGPKFSENLLFFLGEEFQKLTDYHRKRPKLE